MPKPPEPSLAVQADARPTGVAWGLARERIWTLTEMATGRSTSEAFSCLYFAAGVLGALRGEGARFAAGGASLGDGGVHAWGLIVNPRDNNYTVTADREVDDDGTFCGHCWVEVGPSFDARVIDVVAGYVGPRTEPSRLVVYHPVAKLRASIRKRHGGLLDEVTRLAHKDEVLRRFMVGLC